MTRLFSGVLLALSVALMVSACGDGEEATANRGRGAQGPVLVETIEARIQPVTRRVESVGTLYGDESVTLTAKVTEQVSAVHFEGGELVEAGQVLAELMDAEQLALLSEAEANLREAELQLERLVTLGQEIATAAEIDVASARVDASAAQLDAIRSRLADRRIVAPFSGVIGFRRISVGALLTPGTIIAELDAIDPLKLDFSLPELFLAEVSVGDTIRGSSVAWPGLEFAGEVTRISSRVDPVSRAFQVRLTGSTRLLMRVTSPANSRPGQATLLPRIVSPTETSARKSSGRLKSSFSGSIASSSAMMVPGVRSAPTLIRRKPITPEKGATMRRSARRLRIASS